ncbi:PaaI family thioesterase [Mycobacterium sp. TY813]|uniref:PaaI family thioesterase n=1 Tax=Mycobacterium TaxID=1763 RepID=UPI002740AB6D|nr:PaaI family thioesterase [Mycobacterium sp. TY813]MDP7732997.1 PaaI family thioesterase [Mycobacterium sp. TY813]
MSDDLSRSVPTLTAEDLTAAVAAVFDGHIGLKFTEASTVRVRAAAVVGPELLQRGGVVHGGVYSSIVESVASWGATLSLEGAGYAVGVNNNTDFLRSASDGTLLAEGTPVFRGRTQQLWRVVITDAGARECAIGQVRLHNIFQEGLHNIFKAASGEQRRVESGVPL